MKTDIYGTTDEEELIRIANSHSDADGGVGKHYKGDTTSLAQEGFRGPYTEGATIVQDNGTTHPSPQDSMVAGSGEYHYTEGSGVSGKPSDYGQIDKGDIVPDEVNLMNQRDKYDE